MNKTSKPKAIYSSPMAERLGTFVGLNLLDSGSKNQSNPPANPPMEEGDPGSSIGFGTEGGQDEMG